MSRPICQICGGTGIDIHWPGRADDFPACQHCNATSRPADAVTMGVDLAQPHAHPYTPSRATGDTWTPRDTHNAEIESAGGADLQMARAVAHIKEQAARIETLVKRLATRLESAKIAGACEALRQLAEDFPDTAAARRALEMAGHMEAGTMAADGDLSDAEKAKNPADYPKEARIAQLEEALWRARLHGLHNARRPSFPDAQRLGDWIDAGCVGQPPELMARFVLDAIDQGDRQ